MGNIVDGRLEVSELKYLPAAHVEFPALLLESGDLLFNRTNSSELVGKTAVYGGAPSPCSFASYLIRVQLNSACEPALLSAYINSVLGRSWIASVANQQVGQANVNGSKLKALRVPLPPLAEQRRIMCEVDRHFTRVDAGIAALKRLQANLKRYRASVLKTACEGRLVPTEAEIARKEGREYEPAEVLLQRILKERRGRWEESQLAKMKAKGQEPRDDRWMAKYEDAMKLDKGDLPEGWVWATVEMVGDILLGRQRAPQYLTGKWSHSYLRVANIKDDRIDFDDVETMDFDPEHFAKYCLEPGDILVSEGQSPDRVGESAIYGGGVDGLCFQKTLHRFRPVRSGPSSQFAQIVFRSHVKQGVFRKMASITTNIAHLTLEKFQAAPFPLPPLAEQHRIVAEVDRLLSVADTTEQAVRAQLARARRLRQAVLQRAFEGKLVPQDPTDEPASRLLERIQAREGEPAKASVPVVS
jgi:type I restriction enzyme S subunit